MSKKSGFKFGTIHSHAIPLGLILAYVLTSAGIAQAQQVPVDNLRGLVSKIIIGDRIQVVNKSGKTVNAKLEGMSGTSIHFTAYGRSRELLESEIREIRIHRRERKGDGALIGLVAGAILGGIGGNLACAHDPECAVAMVPAMLALGGGLGAGTGELVDIMTDKYDAVFRAPAATTGLHISLSTVVSRKRKGAALSFTF